MMVRNCKLDKSETFDVITRLENLAEPIYFDFGPTSHIWAPALHGTAWDKVVSWWIETVDTIKKDNENAAMIQFERQQILCAMLFNIQEEWVRYCDDKQLVVDVKAGKGCVIKVKIND